MRTPSAPNAWPRLAAASIAVMMLFSITPARAQSRDLVKFERAKEQFRQGMVHFNNMRYLASVEFFRKALVIHPDYYTAREYLARSYRLAGFTDEALNEWEILSDEAPDNVLVRARIDAIRFREGGLFAPGRTGEFVLAGEYASSDLKRFRFPHPVDVAVDTARNAYITSFSSGKLVKIDPNKQGLDVFAPALDSKLYGIDYYRGRLAVTDFGRDCVYLMDEGMKIQRTFGSTGNGEGLFHGPQGVCFDPRGNIYVVDSGNHRVQKFDDNGAFILTFGKQGSYEGQLEKPSDCAADRERVYVTDTGNNRVAVFDDSGNFLDNLSIEGSEKPRGITLHNSSLLVADEKQGLIFFDPTSKSATTFASWEGGKRSFRRPYAGLVDRDGFLYCLDYLQERLFIFSPLERRYSNYDIEIASIDVKKFPAVALYLNVRDRGGKALYGLTRDNFSVTEDGARPSGIYVDYLKDKSPSASMVLCVDRSRTMGGYHNDIPWVAEFVLKKMRRDDSLKVAGFNDDYRTENDFDWSRRRALKALKARPYGEGKNIGKALYNALADVAPRINRRGVILLTDGVVADDSFVRYSEKIIIDFANSHHIPVYIVCLKEKNPVLERIAAATGGAVFTAREMDGLRSIYDRIRKGEEYRYVLVYSTFKSPTLKGWWSDIRIEVNYRNQKGTEWGGYFVP
jgi:DNA-binding beta-propeller fold protein YncE